MESTTNKGIRYMLQSTANREKEMEDAKNLPMSMNDLKSHVSLVQQVMRDVMIEKTHYGVIPGTSKPTLYKAGAEKLLLTFHLAPEYKIMEKTEEDSQIMYVVSCRLTHAPTGRFVGDGVGACNSKEKKYEKNDPWYLQNTILKMASKRALLSAILNVTAASDIFTQDFGDNEIEKETDRPLQNTTQTQAGKVEAHTTGKPLCIDCNDPISPAVANYSLKQFGSPVCFADQKRRQDKSEGVPF